jgi:flagellar protein FlaG
VPNESQSQGSVPKTSITSVAAEAEQEKLRSLGTLQSVNESIDDAVEVLNQALSLRNTAASITRDEELNRYLVTIRDKESGEVVREIPDEALIKFARNLQELRGILFDETT